MSDPVLDRFGDLIKRHADKMTECSVLRAQLEHATARLASSDRALREALDAWESWTESEYIGTSVYDGKMAKIAELRKLVSE